MKLVNNSTGEVLAGRIDTANSFMSRLTGLMGKKEMPDGYALLLKPCSQIHTFFMKFSIDVIFLDRNWTARHIIENMLPWRISPFVPGAKFAAELPGGKLKNRVSPGDILKLEE
ncbi:MAG: DUF192 domain-containing protein [Bacillota bacterium]